ncbi:MAG: serine hydrolase, partial [Pirellulaceae bacterium]
MVNESRKIDESWLRLVGRQYLRRSFGIGVVLGILVALARPTFAQDAWKGQIEQWVKEHRGEVAIYVNWADSSTDADPPPLLEIACDRPMPTASLIKVAVLAELYRQIARKMVSSDELMELRKEDAVPG